MGRRQRLRRAALRRRLPHAGLACGARSTVMEEHPGVGMVYGRAAVLRTGPDAAAGGGDRWRGTTVWAGARWIERRCRTAHNCISSPEVVVRTSVQRAVGGYDPACYHTTDLNMWLRIAAVADVAYVRGAVQALYRIHSESMLRSRRRPAGRPARTARRLRALLRRAAGSAAAAAPSATAARRPPHARPPGALAGQPRLRPRRGRGPGRGAGRRAGRLRSRDLSRRPRRLREWRGLRLRRRIGAGRSLLFVPFVATGAGHRVRSQVGRLRWRLSGV